MDANFNWNLEGLDEERFHGLLTLLYLRSQSAQRCLARPNPPADGVQNGQHVEIIDSSDEENPEERETPTSTRAGGAKSSRR